MCRDRCTVETRDYSAFKNHADHVQLRYWSTLSTLPVSVLCQNRGPRYQPPEGTGNELFFMLLFEIFVLLEAQCMSEVGHSCCFPLSRNSKESPWSSWTLFSLFYIEILIFYRIKRHSENINVAAISSVDELWSAFTKSTDNKVKTERRWKK